MGNMYEYSTGSIGNEIKVEIFAKKNCFYSNFVFRSTKMVYEFVKNVACTH